MQDPTFNQANDDIIFRQTRREFRNIFDKTNNWAPKQEVQGLNEYSKDDQFEENDFSHNFLHDDNMSYKPLQSEFSQVPSFYPQSNYTMECSQSMNSIDAESHIMQMKTGLNLNAKCFQPK